MDFPALLAPLAGKWNGKSRMWLSPGEEAEESGGTAGLSFSAQGKVAELRYTWSIDGDPEDGLLLLRALRGGIQAVWSDSWHTPDGFMLCSGSVDSQGVIRLCGAYPQPPGPDWSWRIEIDLRQGSALRLIMYCITPEGEETRAVQADYTRAR